MTLSGDIAIQVAEGVELALIRGQAQSLVEAREYAVRLARKLTGGVGDERMTDWEADDIVESRFYDYISRHPLGGVQGLRFGEQQGYQQPERSKAGRGGTILTKADEVRLEIRPDGQRTMIIKGFQQLRME